MKKKNQKKCNISIDIEALKHWKNVSNKAKLDWLESAMRLGKLRKF